MATFVKFHTFVEALAEGAHDLGSDQLKIALTNTAPTAATDADYSDLTSPVAGTNLDGATPFNVTTSTSAQTSGTYKLVCDDLTLTATGEVGPFRYVVLYNDDSTGDLLIGYYDYGSEVTMSTGETFVVDFDGSNGVLTIA
jgi:hypothetical protein